MGTTCLFGRTRLHYHGSNRSQNGFATPILLQKRFHGVENSIPQPPTQPCTSHPISSTAESNRQNDLRMADCAREIRESCERILKLLQEEIDVAESTNDAVLTSEETPPFDENVKTVEESVTPIVRSPLLNQDASYSYPMTGAFPKGMTRFHYLTSLSLSVVDWKSYKGCLIHLPSMLISLFLNVDPLLLKPPHPFVFTLTPPPPPPKPPDRSFAQIPVKFQVIRNFTIHQSPPEPLDPNHIAVNTTILPSYVETAVCPPSVWKNVCVNGIEISTRLSNVSVYLNFKEVFVEGMSNDMFVLGCHMFMLYPNRPITQPTPSFMSSWSIPSAQHHRKNEYEQVILVVSLGIGSYGHIALEYGYTMNAFKNTEAYGYGVVLSNVFIIKPPDISHKAVNLNATCHSWRFVVCGEVVILSRLYALNTQGGLCDDHDLTSAYSFYKVKSAPICRYLNGFEPLFLHKQNGGPVITITISMYGLISYVSHNWLSLYQLHTLSFDNIFPCPKFCAPHSKEFFMMFQKKKLNREVHLQEYEALDCYGSIVIFPSNKVITVGGLVVVDFDVNGLVILVETLTNAKRICCENHWPNSGSCLKLQVQKLCLFHDVRFHPNAKYMSIIQSMKLKLLIERVINVMASRREIRGIVLPFQTIFPTLDVFIKYCFFSGIIGQPLVQIDQLKDFYIIEGAESVERLVRLLIMLGYNAILNYKVEHTLIWH